MTATETQIKKRETWRAWMPADSAEPTTLLSREEFIERVNRFGADVDEGDLRYWEYQGILPRVVKKWSGKANRAYYPLWLVSIVVFLRELQRAGLSLQEIAPMLRQRTPRAVSMAETIERLRHDGRLSDADEQNLLADTAVEFMTEAMSKVLEDFGRRYARLTGEEVAQARVEFYDRQGRHVGGSHPIFVGEDGGGNESMLALPAGRG